MKIAKAVLTSDLSKLTDEAKQKDATIDDFKGETQGFNGKDARCHEVLLPV